MSNFYVRAKGRISGPFDVATLQKLVRRGALSRAHEISSDRANWNPAGEFEELFPSSRGAMPEPAPVQAAAVPTTAPAPVPPSGMFYYAQGGRTVGPVSVSVLQSLVLNRTLRPNDLAWRDGSPTAYPAIQIPELAAMFSQGVELDDDRQGRSKRPVDPGRSKRNLAAISGRSAATGIICGSLLLLFLNLPIGNVDSKTLWWWDILKVPNTGAAQVCCFFVLVAGLALALLGPLTSGISRGVVFVSITFLGFILLLVAGLATPQSNGGYFFQLLVPLVTAGVMATSDFRLRAPDSGYGVVWQGVLGGCLVATTLILGIFSLTQTENQEIRMFYSGGSLPAWLVIAMVTMFAGHLTGLAGGICALVSIKPDSKGVTKAALICATISFALPAASSIIFTAGMLDYTHTPRQGLWMFLIVRVVVIVYAILFPLVIGLSELLAANFFQTVPSQSSVPGTAASQAKALQSISA